jgi:hypothetical protein
MKQRAFITITMLVGFFVTTVCLTTGILAQLPTDSDGDQIPDDFEVEFGLQVGVDDRYEDLDNDEFPNIAEFLNGSDPSDPLEVPADLRVVGSTAYPTLLDALQSNPSPPSGTIVLVPPGVHTLGAGGVTLSESIFIIGQATDAFATVIQANVAGDTGNTGLIVAEGDLYLNGLTVTSRGAAGTGVRLMNSGSSSFVRCVFRDHLTAIQSGTGAIPCVNKLDLRGCLITTGSLASSMRNYGLKLHGDHDVRLSFSTIYGLTTNLSSGNEGMAIWVNGSNMVVNVHNSVLWNASDTTEIWSADTTPSVTIGHSYVRGSSASVGTQTNMLIRHGFLLANSPCINAASSTDPRLLVDIRGDPRVTGTNPDIGAHEYLAIGESVWGDDLDSDGVSDWTELRNFGSLFYASDTDGDGTDDGDDADPLNNSVEALSITITKPTATAN